MKGALYYCIPNLSSTHQNTTGNFPKIKNLIYLACDFHFRTDRPTERQTDIQLICLRVEKKWLTLNSEVNVMDGPIAARTDVSAPI